MISLQPLNRREVVRYLGGAGAAMNADMERLMDSCERQLLDCARPKYLYQILSLPQDALTVGQDIQRHLEGCDKAAMASTAIEQVCTQVDEIIAAQNPERFMTFRFSPGYGDYPISLQRDFLRLLDAPRKIGLSLSESCLLVPAKSVTAVAGLSASPVPRRKRGCAVCNLKMTCQYRRNGEHCGF